MPEFILDTHDADTHRTFDALPAFCQGAIECHLFTAPSVLFPDPDGDTLTPDGSRHADIEILNAGLGNLAAGAMVDLAADAARFLLANSDTINAAIDGLDDYDMTDAGRDFVYTAAGHGVGYWGRGDSDALSDLTDAAQAWCAAELYAELSDDAPDDFDTVFANVESYVVLGVNSAVPPLTDAESAALAALDNPPVLDLPTVGGVHGAPMGRRSYEPADGAPATAARRITLDSGGYDAGGASWGLCQGGESLFGVLDGAGVVVLYTRARSALDAVNTFNRDRESGKQSVSA